VHDNQALAGLIHFDSTDFIISDASRPLEFEAKPDLRSDGLLLRVRSILGDRLREEQLYQMLTGEYKDHTTVIHLRKNFPIPLEKPKVVDSKTDSKEGFLSDPISTQKDQNIIPLEIQQLLARVRTHLDSFTDLEAYSLMFYGYQISQESLAKTPSLQAFLKGNLSQINWQFLSIKPWISNPTAEYLLQLKVASERFLKVFRLLPSVRTISLTIGFLLVSSIILGVVYTFYTIYNLQEVQKLLTISLNQAILSSSRLIGILFLARIIFARKYSQLRQAWFRFWSRALLPALCFPLVWLHLLYYDRLFLQLGQVDQLKKPFSNSNFETDLVLKNTSDQALESK
jgi:NTE family protein